MRPIGHQVAARGRQHAKRNEARQPVCVKVLTPRQRREIVRRCMLNNLVRGEG